MKRSQSDCNVFWYVDEVRVDVQVTCTFLDYFLRTESHCWPCCDSEASSQQYRAEQRKISEEATNAMHRRWGYERYQNVSKKFRVTIKSLNEGEIPCMKASMV